MSSLIPSLVKFVILPVVAVIGLGSVYLILTSPIPFHYNIRNVFVRWRSTLASAMNGTYASLPPRACASTSYALPT